MYLPWMGYFGLMDIVDVFVVFDDAQFVRRSWHHRNRIKSPKGEAEWVTVPVKKHGFVPINQVIVDDSQRWREKHTRKLEAYYSRAPFFDSFFDEIKRVILGSGERLLELDYSLIRVLARQIGIDMPRLVLSSSLPQKGAKTVRLISMLEALGANEYVSGPAAKAYIEPELFKMAGIRLFWFHFNHPTYPQLHRDFVSHLSVIDLLFNVGEKALEYIRRGTMGALVEEPL